MRLLTLDLQASKFKPPRSFATVKRDLPSSPTPVLPSKRLSSDPETPPPSSSIQSKRPRCHTGNEKENRFTQETPLGGVTNIIHLPTPASPPKKVVEFIDLEEDLPAPPDHPSDTMREFLEVSWTKRESRARVEYSPGNCTATSGSYRRSRFHSGPSRSAHSEGPCPTCRVPIYHVRQNFSLIFTPS